MAKIVDYVIIISKNATISEKRAAVFIRDSIKLICGKILKIHTDNAPFEECELVVGKTNREARDNVLFSRSEEGVWQYVIKKIGDRVYLTGLGTSDLKEEQYTSAYKKHNDGCVGTLLAAYHFVEDVLGYNFIYSPYVEITENPDLSMPCEYSYKFTKEFFISQKPRKINGAAMYFIQCSQRLDWNNQSFVIKTHSGKIIVIDGGHPEETERFVSILKEITGQNVPHVTAWLITHLHDDHYGVYYDLCKKEKYKGKITVETMYCNLLPEEFYTKITEEAEDFFADVRDTLLNSSNELAKRVITVKNGDRIRVDETSFEVLHVPDMCFAKEMNINDSGVIYKMNYNDQQTVMFLGDAEHVCDNDIVTRCPEKLKSDVVQVGHHGCGSVSRKCYELIDADVYLWPVCARFWYGESGEGLNTHNVGVARNRFYMLERGVKPENIYVNMDRILSFKLPIEIK